MNPPVGTVTRSAASTGTRPVRRRTNPDAAAPRRDDRPAGASARAAGTARARATSAARATAPVRTPSRTPVRGAPVRRPGPSTARRIARAGTAAGVAAVGAAGSWFTAPRPTRRRTRAEVARSTRRRVLVLATAILLLLLLAVARVVVIDTTQRARLVRYANERRFHTVQLAAQRGAIFSRDGRELAMDAPRPSIVVNPTLIAARDRDRTATRLARALRVPRVDVVRALRAGNQFQYLARNVDDRTVARVRALAPRNSTGSYILGGVYVTTETFRFRPAGRSLAAPLLGRVDPFGEARSGIEQMVDDTLRGTPGHVRTKIDTAGREIPNAKREVVAARPGNDVVLTIDQGLQYQTEQALLRGVDAARGTGGTAIAVDLRNGDVLAIATAVGHLLPATVAGQPAPAWVPARLARDDEANRPLTDAYEPGSVMKVVTYAGALQDGRISPETVFPALPWQLTIPGTDGRTLKDDEQHGPVDLSAVDALARSSNVAAYQVAQRLGDRRLDYYLRAFGFGHTTDVGFPNEAAGYLPTAWNSATPYTLPVGMGISATPMQVLGAYMTIANGGRTLHPRLVASTIDAQGRRHDRPVVRGDRVISAQTAATLTRMLTHVVAPNHATGGKAAVAGYTVAGKTGTARHALGSGANAYDSYKIHATFAGFAPAEAPRVAVLVVIDGQPGDPTFYGGDRAAPVFSSIMGSALRALRVPTTRDPLGPSQARTGPLTAPVPAGPAGAVTAATVSTPAPSKPTQ